MLLTEGPGSWPFYFDAVGVVVVELGLELVEVCR